MSAAGATSLAEYEDVPSVFFARPAARHVVALTFDPQDPVKLEEILDILEANDVRATFFAISESVAAASSAPTPPAP